MIRGELAQLGERLLCTQEVSGSIPLFSTRTLKKKTTACPFFKGDAIESQRALCEASTVGLVWCSTGKIEKETLLRKTGDTTSNIRTRKIVFILDFLV